MRKGSRQTIRKDKNASRNISYTYKALEHGFFKQVFNIFFAALDFLFKKRVFFVQGLVFLICSPGTRGEHQEHRRRTQKQYEKSRNNLEIDTLIESDFLFKNVLIYFKCSLMSVHELCSLSMNTKNEFWFLFCS